MKDNSLINNRAGKRESRVQGYILILILILIYFLYRVFKVFNTATISVLMSLALIFNSIML